MLAREEWEEPGWRIADHTNSPPVDPTELNATINHYPAATRIVPNDPIGWFRAAQRSWVTNPRKGYSLGYGWGYWPDGLEVEIRGWDYRNAANDIDGTGHMNRITVSLLVVVPGLGADAKPANGAQIAAMQRRLADVHDRCGRLLPNLVHGDLEPTACAGAGVNRQTAAGLFLPPIEPPDEEDDMKPVITKWAGEGDPILVAYDPATCTYLWRGIADPDALVAAGLAVRSTAVLTQAQKANTAVYRRMG